MENLIRVMMNPRRGGLYSYDFVRPSFCLSNWPSDQVEIWTSEDDGVNWDKVSEDDYRASYDPKSGRFYVTLLFDIKIATQLGFFSVEGNVVGIGYELTKYDTVGLGWAIEGCVASKVGAGWTIGDGSDENAAVGFSVYGDACVNLALGFRLKNPEVRNVGIGGWLAVPVDADACVGFSIGGNVVGCVPVGATIMGLWEIGGDMIPYDGDALNCLCGEAAWRKQKTVELNGTTPKELD